MKKIGLIGGISWQSTLEYYRIINETVATRLGTNHSASILIDSLDFSRIEKVMTKRDIPGLIEILSGSAKMLENAGAEMVLICANTMHFVASEVQQKIRIPLVSIVDATISSIKEKQLNCIILLGTQFTMEHDFFKGRLGEQGIKVLVPELADREFIHHAIFTELFSHIINPETKMRIQSITTSLQARGAEGVILGCTELPLLLRQEDFSIPVFDTTEIHSKAAVDIALR